MFLRIINHLIRDIIKNFTWN